MVLAGVALAVLSVILAVIAVAQTRAPRGGALALVLGIALLGGGALLSTQPVGPAFPLDAWNRVTSPKAAPGPAPVDETPVDETPADQTAPAEAEDEAPAEAAPAQ